MIIHWKGLVLIVWFLLGHWSIAQKSKVSLNWRVAVEQVVTLTPENWGSNPVVSKFYDNSFAIYFVKKVFEGDIDLALLIE